MESKSKFVVTALLLLAFAAGAAAQGGKQEGGGAAGSAAVDVDEKTLRKLSMGLGEEIEDFTVTRVEEVPSSAGMKAMVYTVRTTAGRKHKCQIFEQSKFGRIATWGMGAGSGADCTEFSGAGKGSGSSIAASGASGKRGGSVPATTVAVNEATQRKISMAIGEEVDGFAVTGQQEIESAAGMKAVEYTVQTHGGKKYKCEIFEQSRFGRIASFGMASGGSGAMCTDFTRGSADKGKVNQASCNGLLKAAGKCG